jgi:hypothetical protein
MNVRGIVHKIWRKFTPPGNRGSLDETYRQPGGGQATNTPSEVPPWKRNG